MAFAQLPGEVPGMGGVCHPDYPPGHVRRYANGQWVHDAFNATGTLTNASNSITLAAADLALAVVGQAVYDVHDFATNFIPAGAKIIGKTASAIQLSVTATGGGSRILAIGTEWEGIPDFYNALVANCRHPGIEIDWGVGDTLTAWNHGSAWSGTVENPTKINFNRTHFWSILHFVQGVSYMNCRGEGGSYDRIGLSAGALVTMALVSGSTQVDIAGTPDPKFPDTFATASVGAMIMCEAFRGGRAEIRQKVSATRVIVDVAPNVSANRTGSVNSNMLTFDTLVGLQNNRRNVGVPGRANRGAHIVQPFSLKINRLIQDGCDQSINNYTVRGVLSPGSTPVAAINFEGSGGRNVEINEVWVKDSLTHGIVLGGILDMNIERIHTDGAVGGGIQFPLDGGGVPLVGVPESDSYAQMTQGCHLWVNRCTGRIGSYAIRQRREPPSGAEFARVMFDETGRTGNAGERYKSLLVGSGYVEVGGLTPGTGTPVHIAQPDATTPFISLVHGPLCCVMAEGHSIEASQAMVNIGPTTAATYPSQIHLPQVVCINPGGATPVRIRTANTERKGVILGLDFSDMDVAGRLADIQGHSGGDLRVALRIGGTMSVISFATPIILLDLVKHCVLEKSNVVSVAASGSCIVRAQNCEKLAIRDCKFTNYRGNATPGGAAVQIANCVDVTVDGVTTMGDSTGATQAGYGFSVEGSVGRVRFSRCDALAYNMGFKKTAGATVQDQILMENCKAINCAVVSDLPATERVRVA